MLIILLITALIARSFAAVEDRERRLRIEDGQREQLPHGILVVLRCLLWGAAVLILCAIGAMDWSTAIRSAPASAAVFAMSHRLFFNRRHWWWMGERIGFRPRGASRYDAAWHWLAWVIDREYPRHLPALLAYGSEAMVVVAGIVHG